MGSWSRCALPPSPWGSLCTSMTHLVARCIKFAALYGNQAGLCWEDWGSLQPGLSGLCSLNQKIITVFQFRVWLLGQRVRRPFLALRALARASTHSSLALLPQPKAGGRCPCPPRRGLESPGQSGGPGPPGPGPPHPPLHPVRPHCGPVGLRSIDCPRGWKSVCDFDPPKLDL